LLEEEVQTLRGLGLTFLQAKVYLALVSLGNPTARETAKLSKIARQEVYRIVNELSEVGLVSRIVTTPTKFKPLPLSEGASLLIGRRCKKTYELQTKVRKLLEKRTNKKLGHTNHEFKMVPEKAPWFRNYRRLETIKTFDLLTSVKRFSSRLLYDKEEWVKGLENGGKFRIVTEKPPPDSSLLPIVNALRKHLNFKFRCTSTKCQVVLAIVDQKEAHLALAPSKRVGPPYLISNHPSFVHMAQNFFERCWREANKLG
jgi:Fe2+ or Zn2+ uptake regulation protein